MLKTTTRVAVVTTILGCVAGAGGLLGCGSSDDGGASSSTGGSGEAGSGATGGSGVSTGGAATSGGSGAVETGGTSSFGGSSPGAGGTPATGGAAGNGGAGAVGGSGASGGASPGDPDLPGPFGFTSFSGQVSSAATGNNFGVTCFHPQSGGPFPLALLLHGFQLPATQYEGYAEHLASFGYVACTVEYPAGFSPNNVANADDVSATIDWAIGASASDGNPLTGLVDETRIGVAGHSLGGKVSVLTASRDARVGAVVGLDPVDGAMFCDPMRCPDASDSQPLGIPTLYLGELTDSAGGFQPCAPAADNYQTFYQSANSPSIEVTIGGANHMSFLDDPSSCGVTCSFCNAATADHSLVLRLAYAYVVSFFERYLRGNTAYDTYLTGPEAQGRYVSTGLAQIQSK